MTVFDLLLFDFDGVLFDTNQLKTRAFELALSDYPSDRVEALIQYHKDNGGISRQRKLKHFFENIMQQPDSDKQQQIAVEAFAQYCQQLLPQANLLIGVSAFLQLAAEQNIPMAICSGGNRLEIIKLLQREKLEEYFVHIFGNERTKAEHAQESIVSAYENVCFFGDSRYDMQIAEQFQFSFCFLHAVSEWPQGKEVAKQRGHLVTSGFSQLNLDKQGLSYKAQ